MALFPSFLATESLTRAATSSFGFLSILIFLMRQVESGKTFLPLSKSLLLITSLKQLAAKSEAPALAACLAKYSVNLFLMALIWEDLAKLLFLTCPCFLEVKVDTSTLKMAPSADLTSATTSMSDILFFKKV